MKGVKITAMGGRFLQKLYKSERREEKEGRRGMEPDGDALLDADLLRNVLGKTVGIVFRTIVFEEEII